MIAEALKTDFNRLPVSDEASLWLFLRHLRSSGLMSTEEVDMLSREIGPDQIQGLFSMLVDDGFLTPFQLKRIQDGRPDGLVIGQYRVLAELGRGGFGRVYKARHAIMNRIVALKVIDTSWAREKAGRELFLREVAAATRLVHPNVVAAFDANDLDGVLYFAMEYVEGPTLERFVIDHGPIAAPLARAVLRQTAQALQCAHANGVVHRDIKPANLLLPIGPHTEESDYESLETAVVKVVDFGIARLSAQDSESSSTICCQEGAVVGTPAFMSPEQIRSVHAVDIRSDLYSLGCTAYYALTGRAPFKGSTTQHTFLMIQEIDAPPLQSLRPDVPQVLACIVHRLMAKDPAERFQDPAELIDALDSPFFSIRSRSADAVPVQIRTREAAFRPSEAVADTVEFALTTDETPQLSSSRDAMLPASTVEEIHALWREWAGIVECLTRGDDPVLREKEYKTFHRSFVSAVRRAPAEMQDFPASRDRLLELVQPWLSLRSLVELDRRTRAGLWATCRRMEEALMPPRKKSVMGRLVAVVFTVVGTAAAGWMLMPKG